MPGYRYLEDISLVAMLATKRLAGVTPEVNLGEHLACMPLSSLNKAASSGFETQGRHHQKSKTKVSVAPQKGLVSSKNFKKILIRNFSCKTKRIGIKAFSYQVFERVHPEMLLIIHVFKLTIFRLTLDFSS